MLETIGMVAEGGVSTPASQIQDTLTTSFQSVATDMTTTVTNVLPIVLGVIGLVLVVGFAIRFFTKKSPKG